MILIAVRIESEDRMINLKLTVKHLLECGEKVFVGEFGKERKVYMDDILYMFEEDNADIFHRTKHFNTMLSRVDSDIIALYDADVIIPGEQIKEATEMIENGYDMVYPYMDNAFIMTEPLFKDNLITKGNIDFIKGHGWEHTDYMKPSQGSKSVGGVVFLKRTSWIEAGGENENCILCRCDDWERRDRMPKLGYKQARTSGYLYHLSHFRGVNSLDENPFYVETKAEALKVRDMTKEELLKYVGGWKWKSRL